MTEELIIYLPFPPTINSYYLKGKIISARGRRFRENVGQLCHEQHAILNIGTTIHLSVILYPPDRRTRDLDNYMKALQDSITHAGVWEDDGLVDQLFVYRGERVRGGATTVIIREAAPIIPQSADILALGL